MAEPLPPMIERNLRAQALLPAQSRLVEFFDRKLAAFREADTKLQVVCTLPPPSRDPLSDVAKFVEHGPTLPAPIPPPVRPRTLIVLDSSFNPPTMAHLRMATSAIQDLRSASSAKPVEKPESPVLRLLLLLAINNADKAPKPAAFEQRLAMMWAFAKDIQNTLSREKTGDGVMEEDTPAAAQDEGVAIDIALTTEPYFTNKSSAIAESDFYLTDNREEGKIPEQVILAGYDTLIRIFKPKYYGAPDGSSETPMQRALGPFFDRASLRVTMRTDDEWGGKEDQLAYLEGIVNGDGLESIGGAKEWATRLKMEEGRAEGEDIVSSTLAREAAVKRDWASLAKFVTPEVRKWIERGEIYDEKS
ncbi:cytidylyltransferase [Thozetella sp. PMI_491]|nr:cytidylyltransferase [Thozetella sp. PMI_491]